MKYKPEDSINSGFYSDMEESGQFESKEEEEQNG